MRTRVVFVLSGLLIRYNDRWMRSTGNWFGSAGTRKMSPTVHVPVVSIDKNLCKLHRPWLRSSIKWVSAVVKTLSRNDFPNAHPHFHSRHTRIPHFWPNSIISLRHFGRLAKRWQHWARDISPRRVPLNLSTFPSLYLLSLFLCGIHFPFQSCYIFVLPLSRHQHGRTWCGCYRHNAASTAQFRQCQWGMKERQSAGGGGKTTSLSCIG